MKKLGIVLLLLALVLTVVPAALAQDTFGASQEDFDAWTGANTATFAAPSMNFDFNLSLAVTGMSDSTSDVSADLTGSGSFIHDANNPSLQVDVTGTATQGTDTTPVNAGLRVVDGNVYWTSDGSSWQYSSLSDLTSMLGGLMSGSGVPVDPSTLSGDMSGMGNMSSMMQGFEAMNPSDFLMLTRDGNTFTLNLDISKLLASPALAPMIAGAMSGSLGSSSTSGQQMTEAQQKQMVQMMAAMFSNATVQLTQNVDSSSNMVTSTSLDVKVPLDIVSPGAGITLSFTLNLTDFGNADKVVAPEGATAASQ